MKLKEEDKHLDEKQQTEGGRQGKTLKAAKKRKKKHLNQPEVLCYKDDTSLKQHGGKHPDNHCVTELRK